MVKVLFDTSILVSAFVVSHPHHQSCADWLDRAKVGEMDGFVATHTLAETYSVLTRLPLRPRISAHLAQQLITENLERLETVPLEAKDYHVVMTNMVSLNLTGGSIYDALIAEAAINVGVDILLTLNPRDFIRFGDTIAQIVQVP